jgi:LPS export ABC transporter protein LptC
MAGSRNMFTCLVLAMAFLQGCENDLSEVEKISSKSMSVPTDRSTGVEVTYSDSAQVKARLLTPELIHFKTEKPYYEMKKGVTILFYDQFQKQSSKVTADYALRRETEKIVELRKNVVATSQDGKVFKSEELIWDENTRRFYSNQTVSIVSPTQTIYGTGFWANESFTYYEINQGTGNVEVKKQGF